MGHPSFHSLFISEQKPSNTIVDEISKDISILF